jgi:hypothetical protein
MGKWKLLSNHLRSSKLFLKKTKKKKNFPTKKSVETDTNKKLLQLEQQQQQPIGKQQKGCLLFLSRS